MKVLFTALITLFAATHVSAQSGESRLYPMIEFDKWGYIDSAGEWVIAPQFERAQQFSEGLAGVQVDGQWGFIDKTGSFVIEPQFYRWMADAPAVEPFSEGLAPAFVGPDDLGLIDRDGETVISGEFSAIYAPQEGLARARVESGYGFLDRSGDWAVEPNFDDAGDFSEGIAPAKDPESGEWGYIDRTGAWVIEPQFYEARSFSDGLAAVSPEWTSWGYINPDGEVVIDFGHRRAGDFDGGIALVSRDFDTWYIRADGTRAFEAEFEEKLCYKASFRGGMALVGVKVEGRGCGYSAFGDDVQLRDGLFAYINTAGEVVYRQSMEELAALDAEREAGEAAQREREEEEARREAERLAGCPDFAEYGNPEAPNHIRIVHSGKERILYFDEVWLQLGNDGTSRLMLPRFGREGAMFGLNALSFRLGRGIDSPGEYSSVRTGFQGARAIDCIEFPERVIDDFMADRSIRIETFRLPSEGDPGEFRAEVEIIADREAGDLLDGRFHSTRIRTDSGPRMAPVEGFRIVDGERQSLTSASVHYRPDDGRLEIVSEEDDPLHFSMTGFDGDPGLRYFDSRDVLRIVDVQEFSNRSVRLKEYRFSLEEFREQEDRSFFSFDRRERMKETFRPDDDHLHLSIRSSAVSIDPALPALVYEPVLHADETDVPRERPERPSSLSIDDFPEAVNAHLPAPRPYEVRLLPVFDEHLMTETLTVRPGGPAELTIAGERVEREPAAAVIDAESCMQFMEQADALDREYEDDLEGFYAALRELMADLGMNVPEEADPELGMHLLENTFDEACAAHFQFDDFFYREPARHTLIIDRETGRTIERTSEFDEMHVTLAYDEAAVTITAENEAQGRQSATVPVPAGVVDALQLHALLAGLRMEEGVEQEFALFDIERGMSFSVSISNQDATSSTRRTISPVMLRAKAAVVGQASIQIGDREHEAWEVRVAFDGGPVDLWSIGDSGSLITGGEGELPHALFFFDRDSGELLEVRGSDGTLARRKPE